MPKRRPQSRAQSPPAAVRSSPEATGSAVQRLSSRRLWAFRLLSVLLVPLIFAILLELALRLAGIGYPTSFVISQSYQGRELLVQNNQFGWRFFGPRLSRLPEPFAITPTKPADTIRIFVLGESAAKGEPQPAFGLHRHLQAILSLRFPGVRFEVVNAAMTAINSHAVLPIARDCAGAGGDIWVVYMGNNEVVGPYGAGTVFGQQTPSLPVIRATLALKSTRLGQALEGILAKFGPAPQEDEDWRGMKMFLEQQVGADDPRMRSVYHHFQRNLADIIRAGHHAGVGVVVSTVPVNLRDCAPFASLHRVGLSEAEKTRWVEFYGAGVRAQNTGTHEEALAQFEKAAALDDTFAELRYRQGLSALALSREQEGQRHLGAARDSDTLRFRCDGELNALIRRTVAQHESGRVMLADAEKVFASQSPQGVPGAGFFYEHVHLTFRGNHFLARTLAEKVEKLLPPAVLARGKGRSWADETQCAQYLGWSAWHLHYALQAILLRVNAAPFVGQVNHVTRLRELTEQLTQLSSTQSAGGMTEARRACEMALQASPEDPVLHSLLFALQQQGGDVAGALATVRREVDLLPSNPQAWLRLGLVLTSQRQFKEASDAFRRAIALDPADVAPRHNLGQALWQAGLRDDALDQFRRAVKIRPNFALGWLSQGELLEQMGRKDEGKTCIETALACQSPRVADLTVLARFCRSRGWLDKAMTNYHRAIAISPGDGKLRLEAGQLLMGMGQVKEADMQLTEAVRLMPESAQARQFYGLLLGNLGRSAEAETQFREALRLVPDRLETQMDLGMAVLAQGRYAEALAQFEAVLQRSPTNELALRYVRNLRAKSETETVR